MRAKREQILLGALVLVLAVAAYRAWVQTSPTAAPASNSRGRTARTGTSATQTTTAPDVHLERLKDEHPKPQGAERNLFRIKPKALPPPPPRPQTPLPPPGPPPGPPGPPPPAPITLKFLGFVVATGKGKFAVLSDGIGQPVYGKEGDTILGRYRILKIGDESIEMAYLDGRGRTTIRMTGS
ncbi:MAG TPA: hypothetical protein VGY57_05945 [Vicinamibacterales bacterium]|nr:hypothetical protein [Vicinamibacterales bacterium]